MIERADDRRGLRPCTQVFLVLVVLTLLTWGIGESGARGIGASLFVLGAALFKGSLIGDWFMELGGLRSAWRWVVLVWLLVPGSLITWAFVQASGG